MPIRINGKLVYSSEERKKFPSSTKENKKRYMKKYFLKNPWMKYLEMSRCRYTTLSAYKERGHTLTKEEIKILWFRDKAWELSIASLNRIKNKEGYSFNNCEFIELSQNQSIDNIGCNYVYINGKRRRFPPSDLMVSSRNKLISILKEAYLKSARSAGG